MATATLSAVTAELRNRMGPIGSLGIENCRCFRIDGKLRCDKGYSEHAWGNAEDLKISGTNNQKPYVDELKRMKAQGYPVGTILWGGNRSDHTDHIHLEGSPKMGGAGKIPPCKGGKTPTTTNVSITSKSGSADSESSTPEFNIPLIGDIGPLVYRAMWIVIGLAAVILTVAVVSRGLATKTVNQIVK